MSPDKSEGLVLLVEDDPSIQMIVRRDLTRAGFRVEVESDGRRVAAAVKRLGPDVLLLDVGLPGMDGFAVCRAVRLEGGPPIIGLSCRTDAESVVALLDAGADDYVRKPADPREIVARIRTQMRKHSPESPEISTLILFGRLEIDLGRRSVRLDGQDPVLTGTELRLLLEFAAHPDDLRTYDDLADVVWGGWCDHHAIQSQVYRLRQKIEPDKPLVSCIEVIVGVGYRFRIPTPPTP